MMYQSKFVASLKCAGQILREDKDIVHLPFGSEYSVYMKNLESRRAVVTVEVDGQDVLDDSRIVLNPNDELNLEGFMKGNNVTNRFKFIQKTKQIQEYRGDRIDDGIVRITFQYEKPVVINPPVWYSTTWGCSNYCSGNEGLRGLGTFSKCACDDSVQTFSNSVQVNYSSVQPSSVPVADEGITVKGSESSQSFRTTTVGALETEVHTIVLKLMGTTETAKVVEQPVTVKAKKTCSTCGTVNKSINKYCRNCGTFLE